MCWGIFQQISGLQNQSEEQLTGLREQDGVGVVNVDPQAELLRGHMSKSVSLLAGFGVKIGFRLK